MKQARALRMIDNNVRTSFHFVQNDFISLENRQYELGRRIERLERMLLKRAFRQPEMTQELIGNVHTREVHGADCLLAKSMGRHSMMAFASKHAARQAGFTECVCLS